MIIKKRTDLALEAKEIWQNSAGKNASMDGVSAEEMDNGGCHVTRVRILNENGAKALDKPEGNYVTVFIESAASGPDTFEGAVDALGAELRRVLELKGNETVLVVGLGNDAATPDSIGPRTAKHIMVTRHLVEQLPEMFSSMRPVSVLSPGVLGTTGLESLEIIKGVAGRMKPDRVVAVDALASRRLSRVCATVQIADTGIIPGSGVGNSRSAINHKTLGMPVVAVGVPTVVDAATLAADIAEEAGAALPDTEALRACGKGVIVTPRDIDKSAGDVSKLIGYGINLALHEGLTIKDINSFLS